MHLLLRLLAGLCQRCQQSLPVPIIRENRLLPVAPVHDAGPAVALAKEEASAEADGRSPRSIGCAIFGPCAQSGRPPLPVSIKYHNLIN